MTNIDVYFGNRVIHLTEDVQPFYAQYQNREHLRKLIEAFDNGEYYELYICHNDLNELFKNFKLFFTYVESAGGIVYNQWQQILLIRRTDNIWQFPKGRKEENETFEEAALREVQEECGISGLTIIRELPSTYHVFKRRGEKILKRTQWYKMLYKGNEEPKPQTEEGIIEVKWFERDEIIKILKRSYKNIQVLLDYI